MNKEENYKLFEYHSTKSNRELRKIFDNSNWNYNIQLFRACEEIINDLQQESKQLKDNWNKLKEWCKSFSTDEFNYNFLVVTIKDLLEIMQELENGDSNE